MYCMQSQINRVSLWHGASSGENSDFSPTELTAGATDSDLLVNIISINFNYMSSCTASQQRKDLTTG